MKNILFLLSFISLALFTACEDYNDKNFGDLDEMTKPVYTPKVSYALTDADYKGLEASLKTAGASAELQAAAKTVGSNKFFTPNESAKAILPYFLRAKYYSVSDKGAAVKLTYKIMKDFPEELASLEEYKMTDADYAAVWEQEGISYLTDAKAAKDVIPVILATTQKDAQKDDVIAVNYSYSTEEPDLEVPVEEELFKDGFEDIYVHKDPIDKNGWTTAYPTGPQKWSARQYDGDFCGYFGSGGKTCEAWLIVPEIDLTGISKPSFSFDYQTLYIMEGHQPIGVKISTDYNGTDVTTAHWTDVTSNFKTLVLTEMKDLKANAPAGTMDLSAYTGKIRIAFVYSSVDPQKTTARLDNILVKGFRKATAKMMKSRASAAPVVLNKLFSYNGTKWAEYNKAIILNPADYKEMGLSNTNFSGTQPETYLPKYVGVKFPYAQEKDLKTVVYNFYNSASKKTELKADEIQYADGMWVMNNMLEEQYVFGGKAWMFDPSIVHTIVKGNGDLQLIVDWVAANKGESYYQVNPKGGYFTNAEYWFGASEYQGNFEMRVDTRKNEDKSRDNLFKDLSDDKVEEILYKRLQDAFNPLLEKRYPNAVTTVDGADMFYSVIFQVYATSGVRKNYTIKYQCTAPGKFTYVEGPTEME